MEKISIGIEKRISLSVLELALRATLDGTASSAYFYELANAEGIGKNRAKKTVAVMNRMTLKNKLLPYIQENKDAVESMMRNKFDRSLLFVAMMSGAYTIFYDTLAILGKYFHVQEEVSRELLLKKLSEKYGNNRMLDVAFDCVMPMLVEAGFIEKPVPGVYMMRKQEKYTDEAKKIYQQACALNNPNNADDINRNPFFEFIK